MKEFTAKDVTALYSKLESQGIQIWVDGGWAVDALLGEQTRTHEDLDIAVQDIHLLRLKEYLELQNYHEVERDENKNWDFVMSDDKGHEIELHSFALDENGEINEEGYWDGYSKGSLSGQGVIDNLPVRCVSLNQLIKTHDSRKRKLKGSDYADMEALQRKFGI